MQYQVKVVIICDDWIRELNPWLDTDGVLAAAHTTMDGHDPRLRRAARPRP